MRSVYTDILRGSIIPSVLNVITNQGYLIENCINLGQYPNVLKGHLSPALGITIIALVVSRDPSG